MTWFKELTGFSEEPPEQVRANISVDGHVLKSHVNGETLVCGELETLSLAELRQRVQASGYKTGAMTVREVVADDVQDLHTDVSNTDALFQVASQFNLLEMMSPDVTPEDGITRYERDDTQGPKCAIAAGASTIYRNYFVPRQWADRAIRHQPDRLPGGYRHSPGQYREPSLENVQRVYVALL